ncbi:MAG: hypothetical protein ABSD72_14445 [Terracidiphilus sp.]|jgi:hypothetical protein
MPVSRQTEKDANPAESIPNAVLIREQLRRLLSHSLFRHSKRYPVLLAYTVEQTLLGNAAELKERIIGVEAFGREPSYDVNLDPVVRTTAAEVRKRLSQYYYNPDHAEELVIELPVGAYVPCFKEPTISRIGLNQEQNPEPSFQDPVDPGASLVSAGRPYSRFTIRHWVIAAIALCCAVFAGFVVAHVKLPSHPSSMERFWGPFTSTTSRVTFCLGQPVDSVDRTRAQSDAKLLNSDSEGAPLIGSLDVSDVTALARSLVPLISKKGSFRIVSDSDVGFTQLREGPFVLIGAFDNVWTMRVTQDLPFGFEYDSHSRRLVDRKSAQKRFWASEWQVPNTKLAKDYAIVGRIHDDVTGQPVIILGGILPEGTLAAGEVVSNPTYLDAMLQRAPKNWDQLNLEAIIETNVIDGHPGPPTVIAIRTW